MPEPRSIPTATHPAKARWNRLVVLERIRGEMRAIVLEATIDPRANFPEFYDWARDLRRGRTNILGGWFRLCEVMQRRGMGNTGRQLALRLLALAHEYVDLVLPETPAPTPSAERVPLRFVKPVPASHALVIRGKAA